MVALAHPHGWTESRLGLPTYLCQRVHSKHWQTHHTTLHLLHSLAYRPHRLNTISDSQEGSLILLKWRRCNHCIPKRNIFRSNPPQNLQVLMSIQTGRSLLIAKCMDLPISQVSGSFCIKSGIRSPSFRHFSANPDVPPQLGKYPSGHVRGEFSTDRNSVSKQNKTYRMVRRRLRQHIDCMPTSSTVHNTPRDCCQRTSY